jgi:UDP-3-O-[3-hydroxymyristoyl] glucosamine N-acyltransferase
MPILNTGIYLEFNKWYEYIGIPFHIQIHRNACVVRTVVLGCGVAAGVRVMVGSTVLVGSTVVVVLQLVCVYW